MTLIATLSEGGGHPVVFGDLLLTGALHNRQPITIPTVGDVTDYFGTDWGVVGLSQKVVIVASNVVIAWAGDWLGARIAFNTLNAMAKTKKLVASDVTDYLGRDAELRCYDLVFVGYVEENGRYFTFGLGDTKIFVAGRIRCYCAGSGAASFTDNFSVSLGETRTNQGVELPAGQPLAFNRALWLGASFLEKELLGDGSAAVTLRNAFGGGYEIATSELGRGAQKIPLSHFFHFASSEDSGAKLSFPQVLLRQEYIGDWLVIRSIKLTDSAGRPKAIGSTHLIPPMVVSPVPTCDANGIGAPTQVSNHFIRLHDPEKNRSGSMFYTALDESTVDVRLTESGLEFEVGEDFHRRIINWIRDVVSR